MTFISGDIALGKTWLMFGNLRFIGATEKAHHLSKYDQNCRELLKCDSEELINKGSHLVLRTWCRGFAITSEYNS